MLLLLCVVVVVVVVDVVAPPPSRGRPVLHSQAAELHGSGEGRGRPVLRAEPSRRRGHLVQGRRRGLPLQERLLAVRRQEAAAGHQEDGQERRCLLQLRLRH